MLRGSAVTRRRWNDHAPFDADGHGTSDLDLTFVGDEATKLFKIAGFFGPGVHSRPGTDEDPDIAPDLVPVARHADGDDRPAGESSRLRAIVTYLLGDRPGQPCLVLIEKPAEASS